MLVVLKVHTKGSSNLQAGPYAYTKAFSTHYFVGMFFVVILLFIATVII